MKLTEFRIQNYRSIIDSGWVSVDDIAVIVGKNESGKTSLLKALWKFNPFHEAAYTLDREWPRGRRKDKSPDKVVATVRFTFDPDEITARQAATKVRTLLLDAMHFAKSVPWKSILLLVVDTACLRPFWASSAIRLPVV